MPQERNKNKRKIAAKTISNAVHKLYLFLVFLVFFANAGYGRKFNDIEMPKSKTKADTDPKIAQNGPTWAQYGANMAQMSQHSPKWPKISPIWSQLWPNKGQHKPQNTPKSAQHEPNMVPTLAQHPRSAQHGQKWGPRSQNCTLLFCKSKIGFAHAPCPPPTPP